MATSSGSLDMRLLRRALAGQFPYRPGIERHPSRRGTYERREEFDLKGIDPLALRRAVDRMRQTAVKTLNRLDVYHLEVYVNLDAMTIGYVAIMRGTNVAQ